ncbi:hypothetical protein HK097_006582, partial [Rhizophlyctis rosea]
MSFLKSIRQAFQSSTSTPTSARHSPTLSVDSLSLSSAPSTPTTAHPQHAISESDLSSLAAKSRLSSSYDKLSTTSAPILPTTSHSNPSTPPPSIQNRTRAPSHAPSTAASTLSTYSHSSPHLPTEHIVCRICEESIRAEDMEQHSRVCAVQQEFHLGVWNLDKRLRKLGGDVAGLVERVVLRDFEDDLWEWQRGRRGVEGLEEKIRAAADVDVNEESPKKAIVKVEKILGKVKRYLEEEGKCPGIDREVFEVGRKAVGVIEEKLVLLRQYHDKR